MSDVTTHPQAEDFDVSRAIDDGAFTSFQKLAYVLAALAIVMDGFDGQMIGYAIPAIIKEWGIARSAFSIAVASGCRPRWTARLRIQSRSALQCAKPGLP
ncbi:MAG: hypothetical protein ACO23B_06520, partial [Burkholderiaceae bacterium]